MGDGPSVSVVIPTFNRAALLKRALESVANQTRPADVVLVCDDGSTDGTRQVAEGFAGRLNVRYLYQANSGLPASARNLGLRHTDTDFVAFLDSDDWWSPSKLEVSMEVLSRGSDVVYHPLVKIPRSSMLWVGRLARARDLRTPIFVDLRLRGNVIPNSSVVVRRLLIEGVGGLDESPTVRTWEDFDLWLKLAEQGATFTCIREPLGFYSTGDGVTNPKQTLLNLSNIENRWLEDSQGTPGWIHLQRAKAWADLGEHRRAANEALAAFKSASNHRFRSDVLISLGLLVKELPAAVRRPRLS